MLSLMKFYKKNKKMGNTGITLNWYKSFWYLNIYSDTLPTYLPLPHNKRHNNINIIKDNAKNYYMQRFICRGNGNEISTRNAVYF